MAVNPARNRAYVAHSGSARVSVIDTTANTVMATIVVANGPFGVAVNPTGTRGYVADQITGVVSVIDIDADHNAVVATIPVGNGPLGWR